MTQMEMIEFDRQTAEINHFRPGLFKDVSHQMAVHQEGRQDDVVITNTEERLRSTAKAGLTLAAAMVLMLTMHEAGDVSGRLCLIVNLTAAAAAVARAWYEWRKP